MVNEPIHPPAVMHPALAAIVAGQAGLMIDCTGGALPGLLAALGGRFPDVLAGYVTGSAGIDWPAAAWGQLHGKVGLFRYDQSPGLALFGSGAADGADIERGAGSVGSFIDQARARAARGWYSWAYISQAGYPALAAEVKSAGVPRVQYGIANWNDNLAAAVAELGPDVVYVQWASPSSNPNTAVPFTGGRTLAELNCDLNATRPGWFASHPNPIPAPPPPPPPGPPTRRGLLVTDTGGDLTGQLVTSADGKTWTAG